METNNTTIPKPYKNNILFEPQSKQKIIGDTATKLLYGKVLDVGEDVKSIKKGDTVFYTQWGTNKIVMADGKEHYFLADNSEFILGILKND